jgi:stage IV sporulation protein FA
MNTIEEIRHAMKIKNKVLTVRTSNIDNKPKHLLKLLNRILITGVLFLATLIFIKISDANKELVYENLFEKNFNFAQVNYYYKKYLGNILPFQNVVQETEKPVFNEKLTYTNTSVYNNGVKLTVTNNYLVPIIESGIVVYIGDKDKYGNTIIVQQTNGVDTWYGNIKNANVKIYDYVEKGSLLGEIKDTNLYLVFQKEGKYLNYKDILK